MEFDEKDKKILSHLASSGRATYKELAEITELSAPAVAERIRKLEQAKVIHGFQAVIDPAQVGLAVTAYVNISPQPRKPAQALVQRLLALPEVQELHAVAGRYSYTLKVRVPSTGALDDFLDRLTMVDGVERTETTMVLRTNAERPLKLPWD
jgi:Lrp/AsnC family leucine-responsive transcriptional regulator